MEGEPSLTYLSSPSDHDCAGVHAQGRPEKLPEVKTTTVGYSL